MCNDGFRDERNQYEWLMINSFPPSFAVTIEVKSEFGTSLLYQRSYSGLYSKDIIVCQFDALDDWSEILWDRLNSEHRTCATVKEVWKDLITSVFLWS